MILMMDLLIERFKEIQNKYTSLLLETNSTVIGKITNSDFYIFLFIFDKNERSPNITRLAGNFKVRAALDCIPKSPATRCTLPPTPGAE